MDEKLERLRALLRAYGSCLVAYSGGVDSVFLAYVAHEVLGERAAAVIADTPSLPRRELAEALQLAGRLGLPVRVVRTREFENPDYVANPPNRCYFCKRDLFAEFAPLAQREGFAVVAYGENVDDGGDFRPGTQAAAEAGARAPLKEAGLTKAEIRALSARFGLPTADKPQMACLSSRVPYGEAVTVEKLRMIEAAEEVLRELGFREVRVRHHEMRSAEFQMRSAECGVRNADGEPPPHPAVLHPPHRGPLPQWGRGNAPHSAARSPHSALRCLARIEVGAAELGRFLGDGVCRQVAGALRQIGYAHVTLDLEGYRRGSLNETGGSGGARG
jgi:uncharacterized protein